MENDQKTEATKAHPQTIGSRKRRVTTATILGLLVLLVAAIAVVAYLLGYIYVGTKAPNQRIALASHVCGKEIVDDFNARTQQVSYPMNDKDKAAFATIKQKITSAKGNEDDPTCQTMLFQIAYTDMDVPTMDAAYKHVQASYDKGVYADSNLLTGYHPATMHSFMNDAKGN